ncbi:MAG: hypothetical protein IKG80_05565, partial [Clostridia bacterium]|nr:hypothetical protein [Clostridia bacterium]
IADWMYENGTDVKSVLGKGLTDKKRDELKAALSASEIDPGVSSLEDVFGIDSLVYSFLSSTVFYAVCIVLAFGAAAMIFTLQNYTIRPFFTALGICALVAAIILMTLFGVIFTAKRSSAPLASVLLSASLMPFMIRGASLVLSGALLILLGNTVKKRKKRLDIGE